MHDLIFRAALDSTNTARPPWGGSVDMIYLLSVTDSSVLRVVVHLLYGQALTIMRTCGGSNGFGERLLSVAHENGAVLTVNLSSR